MKNKKKKANTLDTSINDITQTDLISNDFIIINDTFFILGYNNTQIYNKIIEN